VEAVHGVAVQGLTQKSHRLLLRLLDHMHWWLVSGVWVITATSQAMLAALHQLQARVLRGQRLVVAAGLLRPVLTVLEEQSQVLEKVGPGLRVALAALRAGL
tara:strand:+ start:521 stop:826 length:306 start_codon:yes stop_codon:yes gene_type:complete